MQRNNSTKTAKYRDNLPQLSGDIFLTDGGIETTMIFHEGFELPEFAAFDLLKHAEGRQALRNYFSTYAAIAQNHGVGFILESPTWRTSKDWGRKLGYSQDELADFNRQAIELLSDVRTSFEDKNTPIVISGCMGSNDDGYNPGRKMSMEEAESYHALQINTLAQTECDMITALTMTYTEEAIGLVRAAKSAGLPVVISFTVETDGRLPSGQTLKDAIEQVDQATNFGPEYYMINCAHPTHFEDQLRSDEPWVDRIRGIRSNASCMSHAELDEAESLDDGNPVELGSQYKALGESLTNLNVMGGCCGTDQRHIEEMIHFNLPQQFQYA